MSKGEGAEEGEQITDDIVSVKKEIIADEIADEMIEDEFAGAAEAEADKDSKGKKEKQEKDSVEKQGSVERRLRCVGKYPFHILYFFL